MGADVFLDTNVLVYAVDSNPRHRAKREIAQRLLAETDFALSAQVLQEFYVVVTRKLAKPLTPDQTVAQLERLCEYPVAVIDSDLVLDSIRYSLKFGVSYWDGAILASANRLQTNTLFSEDLNHGQRYDAVQVLNPFAGESNRG